MQRSGEIDLVPLRSRFGLGWFRGLLPQKNRNVAFLQFRNTAFCL